MLDRTLRLAAAPVPGSSNPARMSTGFGGVARNVAENLARLGVPVALVSRVGDDDSGRERGYPVHQHDRACDRDGRGGYGGRGDYYRDSDTQGRGHHYREESYGCRPCHRRWADEESFRRHLQRHHGVPYWAIPRVLVYADWGWLFLG